MTLNEIQKLVDRKNDELRDQVESEAHELIRRIADLQTAKAEADKQIVEARERLKALSVKPLSIAEVIGEALT